MTCITTSFSPNSFLFFFPGHGHLPPAHILSLDVGIQFCSFSAPHVLSIPQPAPEKALSSPPSDLSFSDIAECTFRSGAAWDAANPQWGHDSSTSCFLLPDEDQLCPQELSWTACGSAPLLFPVLLPLPSQPLPLLLFLSRASSSPLPSVMSLGVSAQLPTSWSQTPFLS